MIPKIPGYFTKITNVPGYFTTINEDGTFDTTEPKDSLGRIADYLEQIMHSLDKQNKMLYDISNTLRKRK